LKPNHENATAAAPPVCCDLIAHAAVRVPLSAVGEMRRQPGPPGVVSLPTTLLKHADEQTVVGLSAILHAIGAQGLQAVGFTDWGVLAAPRLLARSTMIVSLQRFLGEGAWGVSPHVIPHRSLHSPSGTVSHALKMRGPNFGVGGGPEGAVEVLLAAVAMLARRPVPGLWVVWTAQEPEGEMDLTGRGDPNTICRGLAVALTPPRAYEPGLRLHVAVNAAPAHATLAQTGGVSDYFYLETLLNRLGPARESARKVGQDIGAGVRVELEWAQRHSSVNGAAVSKPAPAVNGSYRTPGAEIKR
jgi:hypothetical protein